MSLVKLINNGSEQLLLEHDSKKYRLDPDGGELVIDENVAKHWVGDWTLKKEEDVIKEQKRLSRLHANYPREEIAIKVVPLVEEKRTVKENFAESKKDVVNPFLDVPGEKEFEDLEKIVKKDKPVKKGKSSK